MIMLGANGDESRTATWAAKLPTMATKACFNDVFCESAQANYATSVVGQNSC